ncbi:penicillin-binding protein activator [Sphingomonas sp. G124]|uniref:Penicillin-binding protein activator n=1 Tax=Sphingomonas cremea TaxID=2904799 RepID=A0A9X1QI33_9SPHN|nr:penicillin-binding protein activator [Sphingomonas cremea]MCF2513781.1 penicillin-binding protein activator [Sphingomonas cremea]
MALNIIPRQARRTFLLGIAGATLLLAGCQTGPREPIETGPVEPPPIPGAVVNKVAVIVPLTGPDGPVGTSIANAANLALLDTGEKSLRITVYNSAGPGGAAAATQRAIAEGGRLILGPLLAEDVRAAAPIARAANVPVIAFSNDEGVAGNGVYILGFTPDQSISRIVSYSRTRGTSSFAALVPTGLYGQRAAQALLGAVRKSGGRVAAIESYDRSKASIVAAARRLNAKGDFDAVLLGDSSRMAALGAPAVKAGPYRLGTELWATDRTIGANASLRGGWFAAAPDAQFDKLVTRYRARYGKTPYRLASLGYDSVLLAVRSARNWPIGRLFPAKSLIDKDGFAGVDGNFRFSRDGIAERLLEVRQVTPAGAIVISPAATAF